jgi:hypothetical protein
VLDTNVLADPQFWLAPEDRERLLEDLLPWCESWSGPIPASGHAGAGERRR